jgi:hypothetical protein
MVAGAVFVGCLTAPVYQRSDLVNQLLRPREGFAPNLTNQIFDKDGNKQVATYDLRDETIRTTLNKLKFVCKLAGQRLYVCPDRPGICRNTFHEKDRGWFRSKKTIKTVEFYDIEKEYQLFLFGKLVCFSQESYDWELVN